MKSNKRIISVGSRKFRGNTAVLRSILKIYFLLQAVLPRNRLDPNVLPPVLLSQLLHGDSLVGGRLLLHLVFKILLKTGFASPVNNLYSKQSKLTVCVSDLRVIIFKKKKKFCKTLKTYVIKKKARYVFFYRKAWEKFLWCCMQIIE